MKNTQFSSQTLKLLEKASKQKNPNWLDKNRAEYEKTLLEPLLNLAQVLKTKISPLAPSYHFPQKGIGRMKYSSQWAKERGGRLFKGWMTYSASRPRTSRFEHNPNMFFLINPEDKKDSVLVAGGLYMPSSKQTRAIRAAIEKNAKPFEDLFKSKAFSRQFKGGFSNEKTAKRMPKGIDPNHPKINWLRLQAFFVWKPYTKKEFSSKKFPELVLKDWTQILRLNQILEQILLTGSYAAVTKKQPSFLDEIGSIERQRHTPDF